MLAARHEVTRSENDESRHSTPPASHIYTYNHVCGGWERVERVDGQGGLTWWNVGGGLGKDAGRVGVNAVWRWGRDAPPFAACLFKPTVDRVRWGRAGM